eukprot:TRINITY_DN78400_c0_g1_i1.p1 TRINITY_DN78400_c0_g1~~TRINITY_DN78400_c0_g1_i1.p1  ORF type:complete len:224 (-),score=28.34 TRINITY_DN78400_c0_g1_i1:77-724(-)
MTISAVVTGRTLPQNLPCLVVPLAFKGIRGRCSKAWSHSKRPTCGADCGSRCSSRAGDVVRRALPAGPALNALLGLSGLTACVLKRRSLSKMLCPPSFSRLAWSANLWAILTSITVFDLSGNAIGYPVFFAFLLTYMRDREGAIAGSWKEVWAVFALLALAVFAGVWISSLPASFLPLRRSWRTVLRLRRLQSFCICLMLWLVVLFFRVFGTLKG